MPRVLPPRLGATSRPPAGRYLMTVGPAATTLSLSALTAAGPLWLSQPVPIDRICIEVTTAGDVLSVVGLAVYRSAVNGDPDLLLFDAGTVVSTSTGIKEITVAQTLPAGKLWLAATTHGHVATAANVRALSGSYAGMLPLDQAEAANDARGSARISSASNPFPANWVNGTARGFQPRVFVRVA